MIINTLMGIVPQYLLAGLDLKTIFQLKIILEKSTWTSEARKTFLKKEGKSRKGSWWIGTSVMILAIKEEFNHLIKILICTDSNQTTKKIKTLTDSISQCLSTEKGR